jgi:large subunit ribosomal protein L35
VLGHHCGTATVGLLTPAPLPPAAQARDELSPLSLRGGEGWGEGASNGSWSYCRDVPDDYLNDEKRPCIHAAPHLYCALFLTEWISMRRPKGIKTKKSVAKRFKITASGKVLRSRAGKRHLLQTKSPKRRRALTGTTRVHSTDEYRIKQNLPFHR